MRDPSATGEAAGGSRSPGDGGHRKVAAPVVDIADHAIDDALARLCANDIFARAPQLRRLLTYLVTCAREGNANLKAYTVGVEALGRPHDFDPDQDTIVRVQATRLRRMLKAYYASQGETDPIRISLPPGGYVVEFHRHDDGGRNAGSSTPWGIVWRNGRKAIRACTAVAAVVAAGIAAGWFFYGPTSPVILGLIVSTQPRPLPPGNGLPAIVVWPVMNSDAPADADGLGRLIAGALARFEFANVRRVPSRPKGLDDVPAANASGGGSTYDLSMSASAAGARTKLQLQLSDRADSTILWTRQFDVSGKLDSLSDQAGLLSLLARELAQPFGFVFSRERTMRLKTGSGDPRYLCVLQAVESLFVMSGRTYQDAAACLESAVALDPGFSLGYAYLSVIYNRMYQYGLDREPNVGPLLDKAMRAANRAVQTNPASARAYFALFISLYHQGNFADAKEAMAKAREMNEYDSVVLAEYAGRLISAGSIDEGMKILDEVDSNLVNSTCTNGFYTFLGHYLAGDLIRAAHYAGHLACTNYPNTYVAKALIASASGKAAEARQAIESLRALLPIWRTDPRLAITRMLPDRAIARRIAGELEAAGLPTGNE